MKSAAAITIAAVAMVAVTSTNAATTANPQRKRTSHNKHQSATTSSAVVINSEENYDPFLGLGGEEATKTRKLQDTQFSLDLSTDAPVAPASVTDAPVSVPTTSSDAPVATEAGIPTYAPTTDEEGDKSDEPTYGPTASDPNLNGAKSSGQNNAAYDISSRCSIAIATILLGGAVAVMGV